MPGDGLAVTEPLTTALLLSVFGVLVAASVLLSRTVDRLGVPVVLLFLVLGMLGGSEGIGRVEFDNYQVAMRLGTLALALILFDGGLNTSARAVRQALWPAGTLATAGVAMTAGALALAGRLMGLGWTEALLLGAVVSSTDAAAVFAVLRGGRLQLQQRLGRTLELESCVNDPMAVILTTALIEVTANAGAPGWRLVTQVPIQLAVGAGMGLVFGYGGRVLLRVRLATVGLYPALTLAVALLSFGVTTLTSGSGFLAVFVTGVVLGNGRLPYRSGLVRVHDALAWLSQISMFLMLGLLVFPSRLLDVAWIGLGLALVLALIARPLAVVLCMLPFRYPPREVGYIAWIGLRGAVPIILGTFPVLSGVSGGDRIFHIVFFIVVVSSLIPGATIRWVTRRLRLEAPEKPAPAAVLEINSGQNLDGEIASFHISDDLAVSGARLSEIEFPTGASVVLIVRGQELIPAKGNTQLLPGDHVYIFHHEQDRPFIELLFGGPEQ